MIDGLQPYPDMKSTGLPWLPTIPAHWDVQRNGRLFGIRKETGYTDLPILEVSLRSGVRVRDMEGGKRKQEMADRSKYQRAVRGDIAYNMMRMWQGAAGVAPVDGLVSPAYIVVRPYPEAHAPYYAYLFRTAAYMREVDTFSRGIVPDRNRLYWESFKQMPSAVPPLDEQRLIVRFLDAHGALTARVIRAKQNQLKLVAEERETLASIALRSPSTHNVRLDAVGEFVFRSVSREEKALYTPIGLYNRGRGIFHKPPTNGEDLGDSTFSWVEDGDLIFSGQFAWEGAIALADSGDASCIASHRYHLFRAKPGIVEAAYLWSFFRTSLGHMLLNEHSRGAAGRNRPLNPRTLLKEKISIPPLSEQRRLVELVALERQLTATIRDLSDKLRDHHAHLVADVVTGRVDVRAAGAALPGIVDHDLLNADEPEDLEDEVSESEIDEAA